MMPVLRIRVLCMVGECEITVYVCTGLLVLILFRKDLGAAACEPCGDELGLRVGCPCSRVVFRVSDSTGTFIVCFIRRVPRRARARARNDCAVLGRNISPTVALLLNCAAVHSVLRDTPDTTRLNSRSAENSRNTRFEICVAEELVARHCRPPRPLEHPILSVAFLDNLCLVGCPVVRGRSRSTGSNSKSGRGVAARPFDPTAYQREREARLRR